jgi:uncharacterized membrane protein YqjE
MADVDTHTGEPIAADHSLGELVSQLSADFGELLSTQLELAKAEIKDEVARAGKGAGMLTGGGVAAHLAILLLSLAAAWGLSEGMPTVILEAMARGLVVIASDVGAVDELVSADNGWLIPPGNPDALKDAMTAALALNAQELEDKKRASIAMVSSRFKWTQVAELTTSALASRSNRARVN